MMTRDEMTSIIAQCMELQGLDDPVDYDSEISIDSISFVWLQHVLEERFEFELEPPERDVMDTLVSARLVHHYLAGISPDRFAMAD